MPLEFQKGESAESLKLTGKETFDLASLNDSLKPRQTVEVKVTHPDGKTSSFQALVRIDNPVEVEYSRQGGILPYVLRQILNQARK